MNHYHGLFVMNGEISLFSVQGRNLVEAVQYLLAAYGGWTGEIDRIIITDRSVTEVERIPELFLISV